MGGQIGKDREEEDLDKEGLSESAIKSYRNALRD